MARLSKRADGRYQMSVYLGRDENGKRKYKSVYGSTQKECQQKAAEVKIKLGKGIDVDAQRDTFAAWCERWLVMKEAEASPGQYRMYKGRSATLCTYLGNLPLYQIMPADIQTAINAIATCNPITGKPSAKKTLRDYTQVASQIFRYAIENRAIEYNPAEYVKIPQTAATSVRRAITAQERKWIELTEHRARTPAMIMLYAGLRRGEAAALTWSDINFSEGTISVTKAVDYVSDPSEVSVKTPKTAAGTRTVAMPKILADYLRTAEHNGELVCPNASGEMLTSGAWRQLWQSYMHRLHMDNGEEAEEFTPHCLRHTYCTMLHDAGVDPLAAQYLMGHADARTTLCIYTHLDTCKATRSAQMLDNLLSEE